jgi:hypothetical protein
VLAWCWHRASRFSDVRILVSEEVDDLDELPPIDGISRDQAGTLNAIKRAVNVQIVNGNYVNLDLPRLITQATLTVSQAPETGEEQAIERV